MLKLKQSIAVEGTYDKIKLSQIVDATIVVLDGYMIYKNKKLQDMLTYYKIKSVAEMDMTTYWRTYNTLKHKLEEVEAQA